MLETIYTIPVNEVFSKCGSDHTQGCPFCRLYEKLENDELDIILGASMMEPDIRIATNEKGFCKDHFKKMYTRNNRLQLALILESHLAEVRDKMDDGKVLDLVIGKGKTASNKLEKVEGSCYVCDRIENNFSKMIDNAVYLYKVDFDKKENPFANQIKSQAYFCLPHYVRFVERARELLEKDQFKEFHKMIYTLETTYFDTLKEDVSWFTKKFDYRYENEDWKNSKDSVERAIAFLAGR